jgi:hypothetical protein
MEVARSSRQSEHKPFGYWLSVQNQRSFFDKLAIKMNCDKITDLHKVQYKTIIEEGGSFINAHYGGSVLRGTIDVFHAYWYSATSSLS